MTLASCEERFVPRDIRSNKGISFLQEKQANLSKVTMCKCLSDAVALCHCSELHIKQSKVHALIRVMVLRCNEQDTLTVQPGIPACPLDKQLLNYSCPFHCSVGRRLPGHLPFQQVRMKSYLPGWIMQLSL